MSFIFFAILMITMLSGCTSGIQKKLLDNIAEIREYVVIGKTDKMTAEFTAGFREENYIIDGNATPLVEFGVLTITLWDDELKNCDDAKYLLFVGTQKFEGDLVENPFDGTLVADIKKRVNSNQNFWLTISIGNTQESMKLNRVDSGWTTSTNDAISIFTSHYKKELKSMVSKSKFQGEIYIKIVNDGDNYADDFFYHIYVVGKSGKTLSMIISPQGKILASSSNV